MYLIPGKRPGIFDVIIVNDNLEDAYDQLKNALLEVSKECLRRVLHTHIILTCVTHMHATHF